MDGNDHVQVDFVEGENDDSQAFNLTRYDDGLSIWLETQDGEASATLNQSQFELMVTAARTLMGWAVPSP